MQTAVDSSIQIVTANWRLQQAEAKKWFWVDDLTMIKSVLVNR